MGGKSYSSTDVKGSGYETFGLGDENRLLREQREKFKSKFGSKATYGISQIIYPPRTSFKVTMKIRGLSTTSREPFEFECKYFELLEENGLCNSEGAYFQEPIVVKLQNY